MTLDFTVDIPNVPKKLVRQVTKSGTYINYEISRTYDPKVQYTNPKRVSIGKLCEEDPTKMWPNENFLRYFPDTELPEEKSRTKRSSDLRVGAYFVIQKVINDYKIPEILNRIFTPKDVGLILDLVAYYIVEEKNAGQFYPDYNYNHPLFTEQMKQYSDAKICNFLHSITDDQRIEFLNIWNEKRNYRERIYVSYDSTNKSCQAGDVELAEMGHPKVDEGFPIINYSVAYDTHNREPLFYELYPGSINDISELKSMVDKATGLGYKKIGFILDRGYFCPDNLRYIDQAGYSFVIMVKGMASFVNQLIMENKGQFENRRSCCIYDSGAYGITIKKKMFLNDEKDRYFHLYHSIRRECSERTEIEEKIHEMKMDLERHENEKHEFSATYSKYFELEYSKEDPETFLFGTERPEVIRRELELSGYFCIVTSEEMTAKEAIALYESRDASEKLFRADKSFLGDKTYRVYSRESVSAKVFIQFIALIVRSKIYTRIKDETKRIGKTPNYMNVSAALKELEKIEMVRQLDNIYRLDHAVTATQKKILRAFDMDAETIKSLASKITEQLKGVQSDGSKNEKDKY